MIGIINEIKDYTDTSQESSSILPKDLLTLSDG